jgi:sodium transport system permease protein
MDMFRKILWIVRKELRRIFGDRRLVFTTFILPALSIALLYGLMGTMMQGMFDEREEHIPRVLVAKAPADFEAFASRPLLEEEEAVNWSFTGEVSDGDYVALRNGEIDAIVVFPDAFERLLASDETLPDLALYHNDAEELSVDAANRLKREILPTYRLRLLTDRLGSRPAAEVFTVNAAVEEEERVVVDEQKAAGKGLGMLFPLLISIFLFAGAMGIGSDMIAGEKERHTMATLLMTPVDREIIAYGKLISLGIISIFSAFSSFVGVLASMPFASVFYSMNGEAVSLGALGFGAFHYGALIVILCSLAGLYAGVICVLSLLAKTVKEANTYLAPVYMVVLIAGFTSVYGTAELPIFTYAVPIYGNVQAIKGLFTFTLTPGALGLNLLGSLVGIFVLARIMRTLFNNENVMFGA